MFLQANISTSTGIVLERLKAIRDDHIARAQEGYSVVQEFYRLANKEDSSGVPLFIVMECDFLKTLVYPIVDEQPTYKYRATHKSLIRYGIHDGNHDKTTIYYWDSQEASKVLFHIYSPF